VISKRAKAAKRDKGLVLMKLREEKFRFRLYIAGAKPQSSRAISNLKSICDNYLHGNYELEVIDIYQDPTRAAEDEILAVPALVKEAPGDRQKLIGDLSDEKRVLETLGILSHEKRIRAHG
jgi:circadian clock protein KaiB